MKRKLYTLALAVLGSLSFSFAQSNVEIHQELGQAWGGGTSVDINNDGYLDFIITGKKNNPKPPVLDDNGQPVDLNKDGVADSSELFMSVNLFNPTTKKYENVVTNLRVIDRANFDWADIDGDGLLDLLACEHNFTTGNQGIYKNLGTGKFQKLDMPFDSTAEAGAFADFNNDGLMDYVIICNDTLKSSVFINNGDNTFTRNNAILGEFRFGLGQVRVVDINNDGLKDIFVSANWDNQAAFNPSARVFADFFINNSEEPGTFYRANIGDNGVNMKANGGVDFADFNGDGLIDFALHGEGGAGTPEPASGDAWACISHVYLNQKNNLFKDQPQPSFQPDIRPLNSTGKATATIDWNNDGFYDLIITGWNPVVNGVGSGTQAGYLYYGTGTGTFTEFGRVPGGSETVILFNDWNNDGVLDYMSSGHTWDAMFVPTENQGRTGVVYFNTNTASKNVKPSAPANLSAVVSKQKVTLSWGDATDDKTPVKSLSYEYFLKDANGKFIVSPAAFVGGDNDGLRKIVQLGRLDFNHAITLNNLANGTYTWGVQAVDASYAGSTFATGTFTIGGGNVAVNNVAKSVSKVYAVDNNVVVELKDANKATVTIYTLTGQQVMSKVINNHFNTQLSSGCYLVKVVVDGNVETSKVVVK